MNMNLSLLCARVFFGILSAVFLIIYTVSFPEGSTSMKVFMGACLAGSFSLLLMGIESMFRKFNLRAFNTIALGLFFGYLMGKGLSLSFDAFLKLGSISGSLSGVAFETIRAMIYLVGLYFGTLFTIKAADEIYLSIPLVQFSQTTRKKKDVVLDLSTLSDPRILDFCSSGILNNQAVIAHFVIKYLEDQLESSEETTKAKARKTLDVIRKLKESEALEAREDFTDFPEIKDLHQKFHKLAKSLEANILTADFSRAQLNTQEGVTYISLHNLSNTLRPMMPPGETITIKVQRYGKEPKQGVGYLEDGTMVVINNGGDFIGEVIDSQVISVKQTSAGRIIFTNAVVDESAQPVGHGCYNYEHQGVYEHQHES